MSPAAAKPGLRILPMGERALLVEVGDLDEVLALHERLSAGRIPGVVDLVPAARTVLVQVDPALLALPAARAWVLARSGADAAPSGAVPPAGVELDIVYDGADLVETAELLGITADELVRRHSSAVWSVAFTGFAPGFGYLVSPDWPYDIPRLPSPRTRVPPGAVGLAAEFTGAYPRESPGGWRLIGTTAARLFDADAATPASAVLLSPGTRVTFRTPPPSPPPTPRPGAETASARPNLAETPPSRRPAAVSRGRGGGGDGGTRGEAAVRVIEPGLLATVQDLGRPGVGSLGVAGSGALDRGALRTANRLVGNPEHLAAIEVTMGGFRAVALRDLWWAVSGAWGPIRLAGRQVDPYEAQLWPAGDELQLDAFRHGVRAYLALRGGVDARRVLGSSATDLLAGLGPDRLGVADTISVGPEPALAVPATPLAPWGAPHDDQVELALSPGPRADWFAASALPTLFESVWTVTNDADRVGARLDGPALERRTGRELPSEGMVAGALQVPPSGRPTILLADGPVTGGYPVIAVVADAALDLLAQCRPGTRIRFRHSRPA